MQKIRFRGVKPFSLAALALLTHTLLSLYEKQALRQTGELPPHLQPLFIAAAPRTGSTLLYQALTNSLDVLYPDNLSQHFYRNFYTGMCLSHSFFGSKPHNCFESEHGQTYPHGLHAPADLAGFWYRWFPYEEDFLEPEDITEKAKSALQDNISALSAQFNKPFIFKNQHHSQRLRLLRDIFPDMKVIFLKRQPVDTILSLYRARQKKKVEESEWWSVKPKNWKELRSLAILERLVMQVYFLEKEIYDAGKTFPSEHFMTLHYKEFCKAPEATILAVRQNFFENKTPPRTGAGVVKIAPRTTETNHPLRSEIEAIASKYDWENYSCD